MRIRGKVLLPVLSTLAALVPVAAHAEAQGSPSSPFLVERFDGAAFPPAGWTVIDNGGSGVVWSNVAGSLETGNFTGGAGDAASVSSDLAGTAEFDTELRSPQISLPAATPIGLHYLANYQNFNGLDFLDLDFSTDGGTSWTNLLSWNEDHGTFRDVPGECVNLDLSAHAGTPSFMLRFRYRDPNTGDWDWYAQIDEVRLDDVVGSMCPLFLDGFESGDTTAWSAAQPLAGARKIRPERRRHRVELKPPGAESAPSKGIRRERQRRLEKLRADGMLGDGPKRETVRRSLRRPPGR
jgi:hypothetical protein